MCVCVCVCVRCGGATSIPLPIVVRVESSVVCFVLGFSACLLKGCLFSCLESFLGLSTLSLLLLAQLLLLLLPAALVYYVLFCAAAGHNRGAFFSLVEPSLLYFI